VVLTAGEYRDEAAAICERANKRLGEEMPEGALAETVAFAEEVARDAYESLARLMPPSELAELHNEMLMRTHALLADFAPLVAAAKVGMTEFARASAEQSERNRRLGPEIEELWPKLGVPECNR
jgi:hypothetical protein